MWLIVLHGCECCVLILMTSIAFYYINVGWWQLFCYLVPYNLKNVNQFIVYPKLFIQKSLQNPTFARVAIAYHVPALNGDHVSIGCLKMKPEWCGTFRATSVTSAPKASRDALPGPSDGRRSPSKLRERKLPGRTCAGRTKTTASVCRKRPAKIQSATLKSSHRMTFRLLVRKFLVGAETDHMECQFRVGTLNPRPVGGGRGWCDPPCWVFAMHAKLWVGSCWNSA